jgi:hypothetical protein
MKLIKNPSFMLNFSVTSCNLDKCLNLLLLIYCKKETLVTKEEYKILNSIQHENNEIDLLIASFEIHPINKQLYVEKKKLEDILVKFGLLTQRKNSFDEDKTFMTKIRKVAIYPTKYDDIYTDYKSKNFLYRIIYYIPQAQLRWFNSDNFMYLIDNKDSVFLISDNKILESKSSKKEDFRGNRIVKKKLIIDLNQWNQDRLLDVLYTAKQFGSSLVIPYKFAVENIPLLTKISPYFEYFDIYGINFQVKDVENIRKEMQHQAKELVRK